MHDYENDYELNDLERQQAHDALESVLATDKFEAAPQMSAFLRYVVQQAADGNQSRIKAFTVAVDALGKPDSFDPQNDPVVRVLAGRLRAALASYNEEHPDAALKIVMTPGSYVPRFVHPGVKEGESEAADQHTNPATESTPEPTDNNAQAGWVEHHDEHDNAVNDAGADNLAHNDTSTSDNDIKPIGDDVHTDTQSTVPTQINHSTSQSHSEKVTTSRFWIAAAIVAAIAIGFWQTRMVPLATTPSIQAATPGNSANTLTVRPAGPSLFITAIERGDELENSLNTLISGVISESDVVRVYRIIDPEQQSSYSAEDYLLDLTALKLPGETRVDLQLMEAQSGRIIHTQAVSLNENAAEQLNQGELARLISASLELISTNGPLLTNHAARAAGTH